MLWFGGKILIFGGMKREIYWVDGVRALCVIMVYFAHSVAIGGFGIPLAVYRLYDFVYVYGFFFVSGYLLFGKQLSHPVIGSSADDFLKGEGKKLLENIFYRIIVDSQSASVSSIAPELNSGLGSAEVLCISVAFLPQGCSLQFRFPCLSVLRFPVLSGISVLSGLSGISGLSVPKREPPPFRAATQRTAQKDNDNFTD